MNRVYLIWSARGEGSSPDQVVVWRTDYIDRDGNVFTMSGSADHALFNRNGEDMLATVMTVFPNGGTSCEDEWLSILASAEAKQ